jgi:cytochrome c
MPWAAGGHGEHAEGELTQAYTIDTGDAGAAPKRPRPKRWTLPPCFAAGDAAAGEKVFGKCKACHKLDGGRPPARI